MLCAEAPHNVNDQVSKTPEMYLGSAASTMATLGGNGLYRSALRGEQRLVITSESAHWLADFGWSKDDVRQFIFEHARKPMRELRDRGAWGKSPLPEYVDANDDDAMVPIVNRPGKHTGVRRRRSPATHERTAHRRLQPERHPRDHEEGRHAADGRRATSCGESAT